MKLLIGDSDFSFVIETIVFSFEFLIVILLLLCVTLGDQLKGLFNVKDETTNT